MLNVDLDTCSSRHTWSVVQSSNELLSIYAPHSIGYDQSGTGRCESWSSRATVGSLRLVQHLGRAGVRHGDLAVVHDPPPGSPVQVMTMPSSSRRMSPASSSLDSARVAVSLDMPFSLAMMPMPNSGPLPKAKSRS